MESLLQELHDSLNAYLDTFVSFLPKLMVALVLLVIYIFMAGWMRKKFVRFITTKLDDITLVNFFSKVFKAVNVIIGILIFLTVTGKTGVASSLLGATSLSAIVIGFAFKDIVENFLAGIIMAFKRRYSVGDTIKTNGVEGVIVALNIRDTHIKTFDGKDVFVPNGIILKSPLYNYTIDGYLRFELELNVEGEADIDLTKQLIIEAVKQDQEIMVEDKAPYVFLSGLDATGQTFKVHYWLDLDDISKGGLAIRTEAYKRVKRILNENGIHLKHSNYILQQPQDIN
jgi:small conductance mechanosensitive channel